MASSYSASTLRCRQYFKKSEYKAIKAHAISWLCGDSDDSQQVCLMANLEADFVKQKAKEAIKRNCIWRKSNNVFIKKNKKLTKIKYSENQIIKSRNNFNNSSIPH